MENIAFVIAQHLSPSYISRLSEALRKNTILNVLEVKDSVTVKEKNIYITPPDCEIITKNEKLRLSKSIRTSGARPSIDNLLISPAKERQTKAIGITIKQDPVSAKYDGMPLVSIETGSVDYILAPEKMGLQLQSVIDSGGILLLKDIMDQTNIGLTGSLICCLKKSELISAIKNSVRFTAAFQNVFHNSKLVLQNNTWIMLEKILRVGGIKIW